MMVHYLRAVAKEGEQTRGTRDEIAARLAKAKSDFIYGSGPASWANDNALERLHEHLRGYVEPHKSSGFSLPGRSLRFDLVNASDSVRAFEPSFHLDPYDTKPVVTYYSIIGDANRRATETFGIHLRVMDAFREWTNYRIAPVAQRQGDIGFTLTKCYNSHSKSEVMLRAPDATCLDVDRFVMTPDQITHHVRHLIADHIQVQSEPSRKGGRLVVGLAASAALLAAIPLGVFGAQKFAEHLSEQAHQALNQLPIPGMHPRF